METSVLSPGSIASGPLARPAQARVQLLDSKTAEAIAAGEVIERPSSIVKELVENSLDAGATEIEIHLEDGGKSLIEITDNGGGIEKDDLALAVLRHATSKIRVFSDLERLHSFGFRGEALPSISAVARLSILSRTRDAKSAYEWKDGKVESAAHGNFAGSLHGTRVRAASLFTEIPARLKFLKSATAEVSAVREWIERLALTHPGVGFRLTHGSKEILKFRPQSEPDRVMSVLADGLDYPLVQFFREEVAGMQIRLYWVQGLNSPQTRKLIQVVNRRAIRDRLVQQALLLAFKQALLPGQFPALVAYVELPPQLLDVNVHPTKTEVRFLNSSQIFRFIEKTASDMIAAHGTHGFAGGFAGSLLERTAPTWGTEGIAGLGPSGSATASTDGNFSSASSDSPSHSHTFASAPLMSGNPDPRTALLPGFQPVSAPATPFLKPSDQKPLDFVQSHPFSRDRLVGTSFQTYILYDLGSELALVDQHAAHERIRFEKLKARAKAQDALANSQSLLIPELAHYPTELEKTVEAHLPALTQLGFDAENFGEGKLLFRAIPAEWNGSQLRIRLQAFVDRFVSVLEESDAAGTSSQKDLKGAALNWDEVKFEKLASEACHSAIRAGDRLSLDQAQAIVEELFACEHPWNCPHGRPTVARVPRARFEEWFQRHV